MSNLLSNVRVVMDKTTHPGNIGAAARAMKTMGLSQLYLVNPKIFPDEVATAMACNAADVLENAVVCDSIDEALADCHWIVGTSARVRTIRWPTENAKVAAPMVIKEAVQGSVAVMFGTERTGLDNETLQKCHQHIVIPTTDEYSSLNVASAIQIICYEIYSAWLDVEGKAQKILPKEPYPEKADMDLFYAHLEKVLIDVGFYDPNIPKRLWPRVRRFFQRARLDTIELGVFRGILSHIEQLVRQSKVKRGMKDEKADT